MTSAGVIPACLLAAPLVVQPPHLEGDPALATEILPGPPPLLSIQQAGVPRKDHKKTAQAVSYLPVSDPGTTYGANTVSTMAATTEVDGPRRKRARLDKSTASTRAQRATARNMNATASTSEAPVPIEAVASSSQLADTQDPPTTQLDSDDAMLSRSNSVQNIDEGDSIMVTRRSASRRDKGKGKERGAPVKVKEEPMTVSLNVNEPVLANASSNEDHCSACRSLGSLVYCDGCPRAFHLLCLDPPMDPQDLPAGEARWFCPACTLHQKPLVKLSPAIKFMAPLIEHVQSTIPAEFQLPSDIRTFFKDVATGPKGTYVDSSEMKLPRLNRHGQLEERDPYRLKDRNGDPVLCFRCGTSALPPSVAATSPAMKRARRATSTVLNYETGRGILSCDYCHLHWHLDCVDPPLALLPPWNKKWMCPNHADQILRSKHRVPKNGAPAIDITKPGQFNNGNVEVIMPEIPPAVPPKAIVDEVLINGRRYRVPERIITMDFWSKTGRGRPPQDEKYSASTLSSPLTSLNSLSDDDMEELSPIGPPINAFSIEDLKAALSLCGMHAQSSSPTKFPQPDTSKMVVDSTVPKQNGQGGSKQCGVKQENNETESMAGSFHINGAAQPEATPALSARSAGSRRLRPGRGRSYAFEAEDLSEDSRDFASEHAARRQKRDSNGKFIRKPSGNTAKSSVNAPAHPANSIEHPVTPAAPSAKDLSASVKQSRTRRSARLDTPPVVKSISAIPQSKGSNGAQQPTLNVPAPTSLHPSLRYKGSTTSPVEAVTKATPSKANPTRNPKQAIPVAAKAALAPTIGGGQTGGKAVSKVSNTASTGLKIRLPRLLPSAAPSANAVDNDVSSSHSKTRSTADSRPRRSLRRRASLSTSLTGTSLSSPPSPKLNGVS